MKKFNEFVVQHDLAHFMCENNIDAEQFTKIVAKEVRKSSLMESTDKEDRIDEFLGRVAQAIGRGYQGVKNIFTGQTGSADPNKTAWQNVTGAFSQGAQQHQYKQVADQLTKLKDLMVGKLGANADEVTQIFNKLMEELNKAKAAHSASSAPAPSTPAPSTPAPPAESAPTPTSSSDDDGA